MKALKDDGMQEKGRMRRTNLREKKNIVKNDCYRKERKNVKRRKKRKGMRRGERR